VKHIRILSAAVVTGLVVASVVACGSSRFDEAKEDVKQTGTLSVALTATTTSGTTYRLRMATFTVTGPQSATLSTEPNIDATVLSQTLTEGTGYSVTLGSVAGSSWYIERLDDAGPTTVNASLIGPVTRSFFIPANGVTNVAYSFNVDGKPIVLGQGRLDVTVNVNECDAGQSACGNGCTDLTSDWLNCGACGTVCDFTVCQNSACVPCAVGMTACFGKCTDTNGDPSNCGACGVTCLNGTFCQAGACN